MAVAALDTTQTRAQYFQRAILANLSYWQTWLADHPDDTATWDEARNGILRAISFALDVTDAWRTAFKLIEQLAPYMERRGYWDSWHRILDRAVEAAQNRGAEQELAVLYHLLAKVSNRQSLFSEMVAYYRRTIQLSRKLDDHFDEARACTNLGFFYIGHGRLYRAEVLCLHALRLFEEIESNHGLAHTHNHLGLLYTRQRRWDDAQQHLKRACEIWQIMEDDWGLMSGFLNLGALYTEIEQADESLAWSEKALHEARLVGEELEIGTIYINMAFANWLKGEAVDAERYAWQAEAIFRHFSNTLGMAQVEHNLGLAYLGQEKWEDAGLHLETALEAWRSLENEYYEIEIMGYLVEYELAKGNQDKGVERLSEVENRLKQIEMDARYEHLQSRLTKYRHSLAGRLTGQAMAK